MVTKWENIAVPKYHLIKLHKWCEGEIPPILNLDMQLK
jgi:hypothetical protein